MIYLFMFMLLEKEVLSFNEAIDASNKQSAKRY